MAMQFLGAIAVAWLAVRWALGRYKSEKLWERRTAALFDLLTAVAEVQRVNSEWLLQELVRHDFNSTYAERLSSAYWSAKQRIDEVASIADILLPEARDAISDLRAVLDRDGTPDDPYQELLEERDVALLKARKSLIEIGRARIGKVTH
ncbi:hypothetical protein IC608_09075 [Devosia sp. PTR5]|uniref:Uncharacterized protein n=1 Tax=Devosia oryzisoli TaxID=2774138 RepID=A0A927IT87_9HYPH|nr:hypothetical protein [Devosia oryzisoli]MBD8065627.1 hypothetical protein [Devosia oryzisoli]